MSDTITMPTLPNPELEERTQRQPPYAVQQLRTGITGPEALTVENSGGAIYAGTSVGVFKWQEATHDWQRVRCDRGVEWPGRTHLFILGRSGAQALRPNRSRRPRGRVHSPAWAN